MSAGAREMAATARLLGELLLHELDAEALERLAAPELRAALGEVGIELPTTPDAATLDRFAAEYFEAFVQPKQGGPLVQSLWTVGSYEAPPAADLRTLARAAALEHDPLAARGAAPDHLGCILLLWAASHEQAPEVATRLTLEHMLWALAPLERLTRDGGTYAGVARATAAFVRELCDAA